MATPPKPPDEQARLEAVRALKLMDTPREERFDRYTRFAQHLFNVPISFVSLVDADAAMYQQKNARGR